jgi:hypothetical protein
MCAACGVGARKALALAPVAPILGWRFLGLPPGVLAGIGQRPSTDLSVRVLLGRLLVKRESQVPAARRSPLIPAGIDPIALSPGSCSAAGAVR